MKRIFNLILLISLSVSMLGCGGVKNANKTQKGAGIGVIGGAIVGGLIGGNIKGALIGAAIGGVAGGVIGNVMDKQAKKIEEVVPGAEVNRVGEGIHIYFDEKSGVTFATNKASLTEDAKSNLDAVAEVFIEFPDTNLMVQGHTDNTGEASYNMELSKKRANAVVNYLKSKGVAANRFSVEAFGEAQPRFENTSAEGRSKNRRVEIGVSANEEMINDAKAQTKD